MGRVVSKRGSRRPKDVDGIYQWEFVVLLIDVALVVIYFILVRTIDFTEAPHA